VGSDTAIHYYLHLMLTTVGVDYCTSTERILFVDHLTIDENCCGANIRDENTRA
jgi:hypothetical protein